MAQQGGALAVGAPTGSSATTTRLTGWETSQSSPEAASSDIDLNETYQYDTRNRLDSWTKEATTYDYDYDELGNLTVHAGNSQIYNDAGRPHAIQLRANGAANYGYDDDGNVTSIAETGSTRCFQFDSANHLVCIDDSVANGCGVSRIHCDVDGQRVLDDHPQPQKYVAFVDDAVRVHRSVSEETKIDILAFGERIAYKRSFDPIRVAGLVPFSLPPTTPYWMVLVGLAGGLAWAQRRGALILVLEQPYPAGVSCVLVVALILIPVPVARPGGGGSNNYY